MKEAEVGVTSHQDREGPTSPGAKAPVDAAADEEANSVGTLQKEAALPTP